MVLYSMGTPAGIHVLHVDDEPDFAELTAEMLERENGEFSVETATSPGEAIDRLAADSFDCILSDYDMPGQNGIELLETVREDHPDVPFILFTGKGSEEIASAAISAGVTDYLQKGGPGQYELLANRIRNTVEQYRSDRALEESQRKLEETTERMKLALQGSTSWLWEWDIQAETIIQSAVTGLLGSEADERAIPVDEFVTEIHPDDRDELLSEKERAITEGAYYTEFRLLQDGDVRWIESRGQVYGDETGRPDRIIGIATDVTDRKTRERELQRQNERLEEFASVVSHDLRNPLNVAQARVELLRQEHESTHLDSVENALARMARIIDDMLRLAREGRDIGDTEAVDLRDAVESAWTLTVPEDVEAELSYADESGRAVIVADPDRLHQLLENVLRNAIDHGGSDVTVRVEATEAGFAIEDDGSGIPPGDRDRVFDTGYSTGEAGTGFGLSIVEQIVDAHGWEVRVIGGSEGGTRLEISGVEFTTE